MRLALGKSQAQIGEKIGRGDTAVSNYEKGSRMIDPYDALKLKLAFGVPAEWLYGGDESALSENLAKKLAAVPADKWMRRKRSGAAA